MSVTSPRIPTATATDRPWLVPGARIAAIGGPLVLVVCNALVNFTPGWATVESTAQSVDVIRANPGIAEWVVATGVLAVVLLVPGIWAVAARLAPRSPVLAAIGAWLMATGYILSTVLSFTTLQTLYLAQTDVDVAEVGAQLDAQVSWVSIVVSACFAFGALGGGIVLAIAMLRQRAVVPLWAGLLLLLSEPVRMAGLILGLPLGPPLASLFITVAFAVVILRLPEVREAARPSS